MKSNITKSTRNKIILGLIMVALSIAIRVATFKILPAKYFYDSNHILRMMLTGETADGSYTFAANLFNAINIFNFTSITQWGILASIIFSPITIYIILKKEPKNHKIAYYIFSITILALLNIFIFGLTKDLIQFCFFLAIFLVLENKKLSNKSKLLLSCAILIIEALNFRVYYALMALFLLTAYILYVKFLVNTDNKKTSVLKFITLALLFFAVEVFIISRLSTSNYDAILNARYSVNIWRINDVDANTAIFDPLGRNITIVIFLGNYIINTIRLLFPLELLAKGLSYIPFVAFQLLVTSTIIRTARRTQKEALLSLLVVVAFEMVSIIFEPDFGSFVRHEAAIAPFLITLACYNSDTKNVSKERTR